MPFVGMIRAASGETETKTDTVGPRLQDSAGLSTSRLRDDIIKSKRSPNLKNRHSNGWNAGLWTSREMLGLSTTFDRSAINSQKCRRDSL